MLALTGEIKDLTVPWLLQEIRDGKKDGTAFFEQDKLVKKVYFSNGDVLFASSNLEDDRLGEFLLRQGRITREQFDASSAIVIKTNKKLGAVFYELGILSPQELVVQVKLQVKQIVLGLFNWRDGRYRFEEGRPSSAEVIPLQMNTNNVILEGIEALDWQLVRKALPPMKTVLRPSMDPSHIFQDADLTPDQKAVLSLIDGGRNIEQVCSLSGIGDFNTLKAIYLLLALKMAEVGELKSKKGKCSPRDTAPAKITTEKHGGASEPEVGVTRQMILDAFEVMKHQDHFQVLGVDNAATAPELKRAYFRLAKMYHPDRRFEPEMADMKEKIEALFSRVHDAYQTLIAPQRSPDYMQDSAGKPAEYEEKRAEDYVENYAEKTGRAALYYKAGMKEFNAGNFWGAAEAFSWATRLDPVKAIYFYYHGLSLMRIPRRGHDAEENLRKAIEIDPLKPEYHLELGNLYLKSGLKGKALDVYTVALRENPNSEKIMEAIREAGGQVRKKNEASGGLFKKMFKDKK